MLNYLLRMSKNQLFLRGKKMETQRLLNILAALRANGITVTRDIYYTLQREQRRGFKYRLSLNPRSDLVIKPYARDPFEIRVNLEYSHVWHTWHAVHSPGFKKWCTELRENIVKSYIHFWRLNHD